MQNPDHDVELVRRALLSHTTGDCVWKEQAAKRVRLDSELAGLTPEGITELLRDHVAAGGMIDRRPERRPEGEQEYWYRVIIPVPGLGFRHGLFVEIILVDEDPEAPAVQIVNAHEQRT